MAPKKSKPDDTAYVLVLTRRELALVYMGSRHGRAPLELDSRIACLLLGVPEDRDSSTRCKADDYALNVIATTREE